MANVDPEVDMYDDDCRFVFDDDEPNEPNEPVNGIRISLLLPESSIDDDCRTEYKFIVVTRGNDEDSLVVLTSTETSTNELGIVAIREREDDVICPFFIITE